MLGFAVALTAKTGARAPQVFMTTPIYVLCSNFTEIIRSEVGETMHYIGD